MAGAHLRAMRDDDWSEVADLVYVSLNYWSVANGRPALFAGGPAATRLFCQVYEALDPGRCLVAESAETGRLTGACFYRERETHVSLGIMSVHPIYFGQGIGKQLVEHITGFADDVGKPLRLISSAMNLDSFSLYTKAGFVPRLTYQDLLLAVPEGGLGRSPAELERVRTARPDDVQAMAAVERELAGISRVKDYEHFIENQEGFWHVFRPREQRRRAGRISRLDRPSAAHDSGAGSGPDRSRRARSRCGRARPPARANRALPGPGRQR